MAEGYPCPLCIVSSYTIMKGNNWNNIMKEYFVPMLMGLAVFVCITVLAGLAFNMIF